MSLTTCGVNLCLARRQSVARPSISVHGRFLQKSFSRVEKVADERIVEPRLPLLYEGEFKAVVVSTTNKKNQKEGLGPKHRGSDVHARIWGPAQHEPACRCWVEGISDPIQNLGIFGLRVQNTCEANVHTAGKEEVLRKEIAWGKWWSPQVVAIWCDLHNLPELLSVWD